MALPLRVEVLKMKSAAFSLSLAMMAAAPVPGEGQISGDTELTYFGRSSFKIRTRSGFVLYVDPYAPGDYSEAADLVLVSHGHSDHNAVGKVTRKKECKVIAPVGAVENMAVATIAEGDTRSVGPVSIRAVGAANGNHPRGFGVGYVLSFEGIVLYYSGDTSRLPEMAKWTEYGIDYALICSDGFWNMGAEEVARCATLMGARRLLPIHTSKDGIYDDTVARSVKFKETIIVQPGSKLALKK